MMLLEEFDALEELEELAETMTSLCVGIGLTVASIDDILVLLVFVLALRSLELVTLISLMLSCRLVDNLGEPALDLPPDTETLDTEIIDKSPKSEDESDELVEEEDEVENGTNNEDVRSEK